jgi:hypothetical protein
VAAAEYKRALTRGETRRNEMTCSVLPETPSVPVSAMEEYGAPAVIVEFPSHQRYVGKVLQRGGDGFIIVLGPDGDSWGDGAYLEGVRVRILKSGDTIRID